MPIPAQQLLFPRRAVLEFPPREHTADALGIVEADDGHLYFVKGDTGGHRTRASEWLSTHIAEFIGISAPAPMVIEMSSGDLVFGSRKVAGTADILVTAAYLTQPTLANMAAAPSVGLVHILSSIYALDLFIFNDDRHFGNYLSYDDNGVRRLYAFDFSRSLFWRWPWQGFPASTTNTACCGQIWRQLHGFDPTVACATIDRLERLPPAMLESFINSMPAEWLSDDVRVEFVNWWSSAERSARADALRKGLVDGTFL